jgi:chemotaxis protein CheC
MVNKEIRVALPDLSLVALSQVPSLVGEPDDLVVGVYLRVCGGITGEIVLILSMDATDELMVMLLGSARDLGEVANITASFFLNALGSATDLLAQPSPPALMVDMAGAVLNLPLIALESTADEVLVIDTWFIDDERRIKGLFLMFPSGDSLSTILERLETKNA